jgi:hypothetical protein
VPARCLGSRRQTFASRLEMSIPAARSCTISMTVPPDTLTWQKLISWQDPPAWDSRGVDVEPRGRGKFLIGLTSWEQGPDGVNDTEGKWHDTPESLLEPIAPDVPGEGGTQDLRPPGFG